MVQDAAVFFGREKQIAELLDRIHPTVPERAHRFVAVIGPSGAGKSSLVQAGLLPRLGQHRRRWVALPPLVPGNQPTRSLARSLASALPNTSVDALAAELTTGPQALIRRVEELCAASGRHAASALIVIDQAEELLTRSGEQERATFFGLLEGALTDDPSQAAPSCPPGQAHPIGARVPCNRLIPKGASWVCCRQQGATQLDLGSISYDVINLFDRADFRSTLT
jgi:hypothetical protein